MVVLKPSKMRNLMEKDKLLHFLAGILLAAVLYPFISYLAIVAAIAIGLFKEYVIDNVWSIGDPDIWDAIATTLGAVFVGGCIILAKLVLKLGTP